MTESFLQSLHSTQGRINADNLYGLGKFFCQEQVMISPIRCSHKMHLIGRKSRLCHQGNNHFPFSILASVFYVGIGGTDNGCTLSFVNPMSRLEILILIASDIPIRTGLDKNDSFVSVYNDAAGFLSVYGFVRSPIITKLGHSQIPFFGL